MDKSPPTKPKTNAAPAQRKSFLDTSVVIKQRVGHSKHQEYLSSAIARPFYVNNYVRMEFYRTLLIQLIDFYIDCSEPFHATFGDAMVFYADKFGRQPKALLASIAAMIKDHGLGPDIPEEKQVCLRKLEDIIFSLALAFEVSYQDNSTDPTRCARVRGPLRISETQSRRETLMQFESMFQDVDECRKHCTINKLFQVGKYGAQMRTVQSICEPSSTHPALAKMSPTIQEAISDPACVTCVKCGKVGDVVIAVTMPTAWKLHSLDTAHEPICKALGQEVQIHPSAARLKKLNAMQDSTSALEL